MGPKGLGKYYQLAEVCSKLLNHSHGDEHTPEDPSTNFDGNVIHLQIRGRPLVSIMKLYVRYVVASSTFCDDVRFVKP